MTYKVPASKRSIKQNRFEFEVDSGKYDLPLMKYLSVGAIENFEGEKPLTALMIAAEDDATRDALRSLDGDQLEGLMEAWQDASGVALGESSASED